ncbi:MAG: hypothetical protein COX77_03180 [Candidatus Komeilibacteria bacterium CG_4_10_14_0_2_um_filter_37_10]|uniref:Uncharacterized protein n=1 Tax=Candidatus Komeilibacteria bacterium CG_4_10_14_0_2_um_filter_37_10 TaxID=1974470 RepID=A0A2M7VEE0_9BACT|nr:MAG: hypothetical protein COX77_03180 [Candidatus Komeilibacteria bacterium CG_4_10_14_0_2_um_filter_37_10]PJA92476.1 MAG: hypothetical protein CO133_03010 [Candidatus Komeilibacteria bacterium CG_4_9_14_3_um_filter_37_5]
MTVRKYFTILTITTIIFWLLWIAVVNLLRPDDNAWLSVSLFYLTFFFSCLGTFTIVGYYWRRLLSPQLITLTRMNIALRQGFFFSLLICLCLLLQSMNKLSALAVFIILIILSLVEFLFLSAIKSED